MQTMTYTNDGDGKQPRTWTVDNAPNLPVTPEWCRRASDRYRELGYTQTTLAKQLGVAQSNVSDTLGGRSTYSRLVLPLCEVLSIEPPVAVLEDAEIAEFYRLAMELHRDAPEYLRSQVAAIRALLQGLRDRK